jgi:hypothetical protein
VRVLHRARVRLARARGAPATPTPRGARAWC